MIAAALVAFFAAETQVCAEVITTIGKFRGLYYVNRAGVGHFNDFTVAKPLLPQLQQYDGKFIELDVLRSHQQFIPGPVLVTNIGEVVELPQPKISLELRVIPSSDGNDACDILRSVRNLGDQDVWGGCSDLSIRLNRFHEVPNPGRPREIRTRSGGVGLTASTTG